MLLKLDRQTLERAVDVVNRVNGNVALHGDAYGLFDRIEQSWQGEVRVAAAATLTERERCLVILEALCSCDGATAEVLQVAIDAIQSGEACR